MSSTEADRILKSVKDRIIVENLAVGDVARQLSMSATTLSKHLSGGHVRSDSLAKYRRWLAGELKGNRVETTTSDASECEGASIEPDGLANVELAHRPAQGSRLFNVVDLFSGCGGMSLGFELLGDGQVFRTVMALDIEKPMVNTFNENHPGLSSPARAADLTEFMNETEVLAYYLAQYVSVFSDDKLAGQLKAIEINDFIETIALIDHDFFEKLNGIRSSEQFREVYGRSNREGFKQTSVINFHRELRLPLTSSTRATAGLLLWADHPSCSQRLSKINVPKKLIEECYIVAETKLALEVSELKDKAHGKGAGQLSSSSRKIAAFLEFSDTEPFQLILRAWREWFSRRLALRRYFFEQHLDFNRLRKLYAPRYQVSVLLGGPPCQGFSRIGRGKIRSLREAAVHAQIDGEAGDERNRLMFQYVLFVSALSPRVFLFENVQHFQSEVKTPEGTFQAPEVLAECIERVSLTGSTYDVSSRIIDCSKHGIPQTRQRFFMIGLDREISRKCNTLPLADWALALARSETVPLKDAIDDLPEPFWIGENGPGLAETLEIQGHCSRASAASKRYLSWIRSSRDGSCQLRVDAHHARRPRPDDSAVFDLFGPSKRWMDYRCDSSVTLCELRNSLEQLIDLLETDRSRSKLSLEKAQRIYDMLDGSLSIRLILETIEPMPGELVHHLATPTYLKKKDGNHGDWLARLDGERPSKTIVSHMAKDTYAYVHPYHPRTLSVREAARIQCFPDWYSFGKVGLVDAFRMIGNAVPPLLSNQLADRVAQILWLDDAKESNRRRKTKLVAVPDESAAAL